MELLTAKPGEHSDGPSTRGPRASDTTPHPLLLATPLLWGVSVYQKVESDPHRYVLRPQLPICGEEHRFWGLSLPNCTTSSLRTCPATPVRWGLHRYLPQGAVSPPVGLLLAAVRQPGSTGRELRGTLVTRKQLLKRLTALHCERSNDRRRKRRQTGSWEMRKRRKRRTIK